MKKWTKSAPFEVTFLWAQNDWLSYRARVFWAQLVSDWWAQLVSDSEPEEILGPGWAQDLIG